MKFVIKTNDELEATRLLKSTDMACFIFELVHNAHRELESVGVDSEPFFSHVNELLERYDINIDKLIE